MTAVNLHTPNLGVSTCTEQVLVGVKGEVQSDTLTGGAGFNTRSRQRAIHTEIPAVHVPSHQTELTAIYRTFLPKTAEHTFFLSAHGTFSRIDNIIICSIIYRGHATSLNKFDPQPRPRALSRNPAATPGCMG